MHSHPVWFCFEDFHCQNCFFFFLLSCFTVSSSSLFVLGVGLNWNTSADVSVTSRSAVWTLDCAVMWSVVIRLMNFSHTIDASRWISNLFYLLHAHEYRRSVMMTSSPCWNWFSVRADYILWCEILYLNRSRSFVVFGIFFIFIACRKIFRMFK